ncbi:MAG: chemotaxis protein CheD [Maritimibacter sp.]|nr:chemotaxis protein CheD [Maritimibacter sp.]
MPDLKNRKLGRVYISQGEFAIDGGDEALIATLLGSCISACLWDQKRQIGGMNHVVFVDETRNRGRSYGHGVNAMELLLNGLFRLGANREDLRAKVFGGASMIDGLSDSGIQNANFVRTFLQRETIQIVGEDTGGRRARRLEFWPGSGRARVKYVSQSVPIMREIEPKVANGVELF